MNSNSDLDMFGLDEGTSANALHSSTQDHAMGLETEAKTMISRGTSNLQQNDHITSFHNTDALTLTSFSNSPVSTKRTENVFADYFNTPKAAPSKILANEMKASEFQAKNLTSSQGLELQSLSHLTQKNDNHL